MATSPRFNYTALAPQRIRVLDLQPGAAGEPLSCRVVVQGFKDEPYEALSYVWGDPAPVDTIKCIEGDSEGPVPIGANLAKALQTFRLADRPRRIWVDAVCINQEDLSERQSQVRMMGRVFGEAEQVLCWLGGFTDPDGESRARMTIEFLQEFNKQPDECLRLAHEHLHFERGSEETKDTVRQSWLGIKELFDVEYFHRAWIIQEVGLARHARMFWGNSDVWIDWMEVAAFAATMDYQGASIVNLLGLKSWMANHVSLVWSTDKNGLPVHNFVEVLHWARVHRSTDPRDYIYAVLSHPSATVDGGLLVEPNYRISTSEAYINLAVRVIEKTRCLLILAFVDHDEKPGELSLPTWVPDWHALNLVAPLRTPTYAAPNTSNALSVSRAGAAAVLKCQGILVDDLRSMSDLILPNELTVTSLEKELQKKTPFLIDHIWNKVVTAPGLPDISMQQVLSSLSFVLTGGHRDNMPVLEQGLFEELKADLAAFILAFEQIKSEAQEGGFVASLNGEDKSLLTRMAARGSAIQFTQDMTWNSMCRKVFRTANGYIGLGPRTMKKDDVCVVLSGAIYPIVLRRREGSFELVGPSLVYGLMDGEAEKLHLGGTLLQRDFDII